MAAQFLSGSPARLGSLQGIVSPTTSFVTDLPFDGQFTIRSQTAGSIASMSLQTVSSDGANTVAPQYTFIAGGRNAGGIQADSLSLFSYDNGVVEAGISRTGIPGRAGEEQTWNHRSAAFTPAAWGVGTTYVGGTYVTNGGNLWRAVTPVVGVAPVAPAWTDLGAWVPGTPLFVGQCGVVTIAAGTGSVANPATFYCPSLRDNGVVVLATISGNAAPDATLTSIENILIDAADPISEQHNFTLQCNADATADVLVHFWIPTISRNYW